EVTPPTPNYPLGRIVLGSIGSSALRTFLESQEVQSPISIPTSWLAVGHVDETSLPTNVPNQFVSSDPSEAYRLMEEVPVAERGKAVFFATGANPIDGTSTATGTSTRIWTGVDLRGQPWQFLRIYDSSASGSGAAGQVARIAPGGLGDGYIDIQTVYNTTSFVIDPAGGVGPSSMRWMSVAAPTASTWFNVPRAGDKFALVQNTRAWSSGTPAIMTVQEVLADTQFRNLNLIDVQGKLNTINA